MDGKTTQLSLQLTLDEVNTVMASLATGPYNAVAAIIDTIRQQAAKQLQELSSAKQDPTLGAP